MRVDPDGLHHFKQLILQKTEGTPFFMEEVVQTLAEEGVLSGERGSYRLTHHAPALHIPTTVQGVLAARIDRLALEEKALLQQLAVIGREFPLSLVRRVVTQTEDELYRLLSSLQHKEFLYEQPAFPEVEYIFKHALTQEVAYGTVLQERRKMLHERTAQALEALYSVSLDEYYSDLVHHYSRSGDTQKAIDYLQLAGQQAVQRSANTEAIGHLTTALELLKTLPGTPERTQQELTLQLTLGAPLQATKGWAAPEMGKAYMRARDLYQQVGETPQLFPVLWGLWAFYLVRTEYKTAYELAGQLLNLAQRQQNSSFLVQAHYALGLSLFYQGEFVSAREHFEQISALYDPQQHRANAFLYGYDPRVGYLFFTAWTLSYLGYSEQALRMVHQALTSAQELSHPFTLANASFLVLEVHLSRREERATQEWAEAFIALCSEQGFALFLAWGTILRGWALAEQGQAEEGIAQMRQGLAAHRATGARINETSFLALLAEAYGKVGQAEEGLSVLVEALAMVDKNEERFYEAELYRFKGELLNQKAKTETASRSLTPDPQGEACFLKAIEIAQRQQAKSLELRATMSLARLWQQQGRTPEAHLMLSEIYHWFTEGFDTKDLQEAKALIEELSDS